MKLYVYDISSREIRLEIDKVIAYTDNRVDTEDGTVYAPLADGFELSSLPDCSETLRADWRAENPTQEHRIEDLEELVAGLLFGGEGV